MTTGTAEVNGTALAYEIAGEGPALVLLHAGIADRRMWDSQFTEFTAHYRVLRYDRRGSGESPLPDGTFNDPDDLFALLQKLNIDKVICLGLSRGASIALEFTLEHPDMVNALILAAPGVAGSPFSEALRAQLAEADAIAERGDFTGAAERETQIWVDGPARTPDQVDPVIREKVAQMNLQCWKLVNDAAISRRPAESPLTQLHRVQLPTLVMVGGGDQPDVIRNAEKLAAGIANAQYIAYPTVAHMLNMEIPEAFNRAVLDFLNGLPRR